MNNKPRQKTKRITELVKKRNKLLRELKELDDYKIKMERVREKYGKRT